LEGKGALWNRNLGDRGDSRWEREGLVTAVSVGGFLITIGVIFAINPDLLQKISSFFNDLSVQKLPFSGGLGNLYLPAPLDPSAHSALYTAVMQFDIGIAILQVLTFALRLVFHSRINRVAESVGNLIFWGGAAFLVNAFLQTGTLKGWFEYWAALIVLIGVSLVLRAFVHFVRR